VSSRRCLRWIRPPKAATGRITPRVHDAEAASCIFPPRLAARMSCAAWMLSSSSRPPGERRTGAG
jgi:hypothetical protein